MTTKININDHDALNAAFAEKVAGYSDPITVYAWKDRKVRARPIIRYRNKANRGRYEIGDYSSYTTGQGEKISCGKPYAVFAAPNNYTRSMDAVIPWLEKHSRDTGESRGGEPEVFRIYSPADAKDKWTVAVWWLHHDGDMLETQASAPTLPHAAVVALLRAKGVTVEEHAEPDKPFAQEHNWNGKPNPDYDCS